MGDDDQPLAVVPQPLGGQQAADPQGDVGPALAARRPVVELAEQVAAAGLVGELLADAGAGHAVEGPEVALPQPLVGAHPDAEALGGQLRRRQRPGERGAEHGGRPLVLGQRGQPAAQRLGLRAAGVGQRDVGVADVELQPPGPRLAGRARRRRCPCSRRAAPATARTGPAPGRPRATSVVRTLRLPGRR